MKAKVTIPFRGVPDGQHHVRSFAVGDLIEGELAEAALANFWAVPEGLEIPAAVQAPGGAPDPFRKDTSPAVRRRRERA